MTTAEFHDAGSSLKKTIGALFTALLHLLYPRVPEVVYEACCIPVLACLVQ